MMNLKLWLGSACMLLTALSASAQAPQKIGVVNIQKALGGTAEGQRATLAISAEIGPKQQAFNARQKELADLNDQLTKGATSLSADKKAQLASDIDLKKKRLDRDMQDADESLRAEQQKLVQEIGQKLTTIIRTYARDNSYAMIFDGSNVQNSVVYSQDAVDVTADVVKLYDKTYPVTSAAKP